MARMPHIPIEVVLPWQKEADGSPKPDADTWRLRPQNARATLRREMADTLALQRAQDPATGEALYLRQQFEHFTAIVAGYKPPGGEWEEDPLALAALAEELDIVTFRRLLAIAKDADDLKAHAKNWPGSSSNGGPTPAMQEPTDSATS